MNTNTGFSFLRVAALFSLLYCISLWYLTERVTGWGAVIYQWRQEYYGENGVPGGSMQFRTPEGKIFTSLSMPWGFLVYPLALLGIISYVNLYMTVASLRWKIFHILGALIMASILIRFCWLRVFTTVTASF
ncbi:MAG: hypothetical protein LBM04_03000 [Opitutaceae bacterium]|jgi:hypothetical protein|nr:hypothetical protein [Opitutaceae bacterium]